MTITNNLLESLVGKTGIIIQNLGVVEWNWMIGHKVRVIRIDENELRVVMIDLTPGLSFYDSYFNIKPEEFKED